MKYRVSIFLTLVALAACQTPPPPAPLDPLPASIIPSPALRPAPLDPPPVRPLLPPAPSPAPTPSPSPTHLPAPSPVPTPIPNPTALPSRLAPTPLPQLPPPPDESASALSDKPEVMTAAPGRNASGVDPRTQFVLKFSEPMEKASVESAFAIRAFASRALSPPTVLTADAGAPPEDPTFVGSWDISQATGSLIWDRTAFNVTWDASGTEATFRFKEGHQLPTDRDPEKIPHYQVTLAAQNPLGDPIADRDGVVRSRNHFKLTEGGFEHSYQFSILPDSVAPRVRALEARAGESEMAAKDAIRVIYSEPMVLFTRSRVIAGGMAARSGAPGARRQAPAEYPDSQGQATGRQVAGNYTISIAPAVNDPPRYTGTWAELGGTAVYDLADAGHRTVLLAPPVNQTRADIPGFVNSGVAAQTTPTSRAIGAGTTDGSAWRFGWKLVQGDGILSQQLVTPDLETILAPADATALATSLAEQLNALSHQLNPAPAENSWQVTASQDKQSLALVFRDTSGNYIGWQFTGGTYTFQPEDTLPAGTLAHGSQVWKAGTALEIFAPGESIQVTVSPTVLDPAGHALSPGQNLANGIAF